MHHVTDILLVFPSDGFTSLSCLSSLAALVSSVAGFWCSINIPGRKETMQTAPLNEFTHLQDHYVKSKIFYKIIKSPTDPVAVYMLKTTVDPSAIGPSPMGTNAAYKNLTHVVCDKRLEMRE